MSDTPRTDAAEWSERPLASARVLCRQLERELNASLDALAVIGEKHEKELNAYKVEIEDSRLRNISLILERDRWKAKAEEKIAIRREIEHLLGVDAEMTNSESLQAGLESIHKLHDEIAELKATAAAHMAVCGKEPK